MNVLVVLFMCNIFIILEVIIRNWLVEVRFICLGVIVMRSDVDV